MGYLTTFTVYNDGAYYLDPKNKDYETHKNHLAEAVFDAMSSRDPKDYRIGGFGNMVSSQVPRHADENTIYVNMGNCLMELNPWSTATEELYIRNPEFFKKLVDFVGQTHRKLRAIQKDKK